MKSKLTLSIEKETVVRAKKIAKKRDSTVSKMFEDYIETNSRIEQKLDALKNFSGNIDADIAAESDSEYQDHIRKKHGW